MAIELLCRKIGMTRLFSDAGECIPVTVLEAGPNTVIQKKTQEKDVPLVVVLPRTIATADEFRKHVRERLASSQWVTSWLAERSA